MGALAAFIWKNGVDPSGNSAFFVIANSERFITFRK
jgi:hypothetical protein